MAKRMQSTTLTIATGLGHGFAGIGKLIWRWIRGGSGPKKLNQAALFADWQQIQQLADANDAVRLAQAIQQADRFIDHVMQLIGARGATFADRLRSLESRFERSTYQGLWSAHKLRNQLAHEHGSQISVKEASQALQQYRAAARTLGAF